MDSNYNGKLPTCTLIGMKPDIAKRASEKETDNDKLKPHERAIKAILKGQP